jgi:hypothetical protein
MAELAVDYKEQYHATLWGCTAAAAAAAVKQQGVIAGSRQVCWLAQQSCLPTCSVPMLLQQPVL